MNNIAWVLNINLVNFEQYWHDLMTKGGLEVKLSKLGVNNQDLELIVNSVNIERLKNHPLNINKSILIKELKLIL